MYAFLVQCPEGWFHKNGLCLKLLELDEGFSRATATVKCEEIGGYVAMPMNDMYTKDIEDMIGALNEPPKYTHFWIGKHFYTDFNLQLKRFTFFINLSINCVNIVFLTF